MEFKSYSSNLYKCGGREMVPIVYNNFFLNSSVCFEKFSVLIHMNGQSTRKLVKIALLILYQIVLRNRKTIYSLRLT